MTETMMPKNSKIGPYHVIRSLGKGGMGVVYEVEGREGSRFALKLFTNAKKNADFLKERFCTEARLLSRLSHPNLVKVYDAGTDAASGQPYFVMSLVLGADGEPATLEALRRKGSVSGADARRWFAELSDVLAYLGRCGVVHRDVKLENVLIDSEGHAHLSDFGVSRIFGEELKDALAVNTTFVEGESTGTRPIMGTYFYLAPEVRAGEPATSAADLYALGVLFFRLLTGMWYEPGANVSDMLAPFSMFWRERLPRLLSEDPAKRRIPSPRLFRRRVVAGLLAASAFAVACWFAVRLLAGTPRERALDLGGGEKMEFAACPAGLFMMSNIGKDDTTCHKVTITRPFWISKTVVTARQLRLELPDPKRDEAAKKMEAAFPDMLVAGRLWGAPIYEYLRRLNMKYGAELPHGYVFRLPTEAELEYAVREGGARPAQHSDIWWDARETRRMMESAGLTFRDDLRLMPKNRGNGWGLVTLWTDTEQSVLDCVDGKIGTKTAAQAITYREEETDPLRFGALHLSRQALFQRWLMQEASGFIRICIGPNLIAERKAAGNGEETAK